MNFLGHFFIHFKFNIEKIIFVNKNAVVIFEGLKIDTWLM